MLEVKADLDNLEKLCFPPDHFWTFDIQRSDGDEVRERITVQKDDAIEIPNTKNATCNFMVKWEDARQYSSIINEGRKSGKMGENLHVHSS